jgi:hypothetical protein
MACDIEVLPQSLTDTSLELLAARANVDVEDIGASALDFNLGVFEVAGTPHL